MFVLVGVSFVATVVMMGMTPIPLLTREMKSNVDMTVAGNLIVAQFVVCRNNIVVIVICPARPEQSKVSPSGLCLAAGSLAASSWSQGLPSITQGLQLLGSVWW